MDAFIKPQRNAAVITDPIRNGADMGRPHRDRARLSAERLMSVGPILGRRTGFTMTELLIAMAIMAILAVIAVPALTTSLRDTRRSDGQNALLRVQMEQEKWRADNTAYTSTLADLGLTASSVDGHYTIAITAADATGFTAQATGTGSQSGDPACGVMTLTQAGANTTAAPDACWKK